MVAGRREKIFRRRRHPGVDLKILGFCIKNIRYRYIFPGYVSQKLVLKMRGKLLKAFIEDWGYFLLIKGGVWGGEAT